MAKTEDPAPAAEGTPPTGQGGKTPKERPDHQDQWPPNPEPSAEASAYGAKVDEMGNVAAASSE